MDWIAWASCVLSLPLRELVAAWYRIPGISLCDPENCFGLYHVHDQKCNGMLHSGRLLGMERV